MPLKFHIVGVKGRRTKKKETRKKSRIGRGSQAGNEGKKGKNCIENEL